MKKKIITDTGLANSYIDNFYLYSKLSDIKINTSIDLIVLSCECDAFQALDNELRKYYNVRKDYWVKEGNYKRKRVYENNTGTVDLLYQPKKKYIPTLPISLHQPNKEIMERFSSVFMKLGIFPLVTKIELAWDFYFTNKFFLKELLVQHLFLKHQRNPSKKYKDSYYTNNIRKSVKGIRVYPRPKESDYKDCVRLELVIHRPKIKKLGIDFPIRAHHLDLDFRNYFEFMRLDIQKLFNYLVGQYRKRIADLNWKQTQEKDLLRPGSGQILLRQIEEHVRYLSDMRILRSVEKLKTEKYKKYGFKSYSTFLKPIGELNMMVQDVADRQRFGLL